MRSSPALAWLAAAMLLTSATPVAALSIAPSPSARASSLIQVAYAFRNSGIELERRVVCAFVVCEWQSFIEAFPREAAESVTSTRTRRPERAPPRLDAIDGELTAIEERLLILQVAARHQARAENARVAGTEAPRAPGVESDRLTLTRLWDPCTGPPGRQTGTWHPAGSRDALHDENRHLDCAIGGFETLASVARVELALTGSKPTSEPAIALRSRGQWIDGSSLRSSGPSVVPEPGSGLLLGFGLILLARRETRRRHQA